MKQLITPLALGHAVIMIVYALQYQSFKQQRHIVQTLQQHVCRLRQQVALTEKQLTCVQSPDYIASYARNALGMQPIHTSQTRCLPPSLPANG